MDQNKLMRFIFGFLFSSIVLSGLVACTVLPRSESEPDTPDLVELSLIPAWHYQAEANIRRIVGMVDNQLILYTWDATFIALDAHTGEVTWTYQSSGDVTDLVSRDEIVLKDDLLVFSSFIGESTDNRLNVLDAKTGKELWHYDERGGFVAATFAVGDQYLYWGIRPYYLAFERQTGQIAWQSELTTGPRGYNGLLYNGHELVVIRPTMYVLDAQTGQTRHQLSLKINSTPSKIIGQIIYVEKDEDDVIRALDIKEDRILWEQYLDIHTHSSWTPLLREDRVYVDLAGALGALDINSGKPIWERLQAEKNQATLSSNPVFRGASIYVIFSDGSLRVLDANDGTEQGRDHLGTVRRDAALYTTEDIFFVSLGGPTLYAYRFDESGNHEPSALPKP